MRGRDPPPFGVRRHPARPRKQISARCTVFPFDGLIRKDSVPTVRLPDFLASASFCLWTSDIIPIRRLVSAGVCQSTPTGLSFTILLRVFFSSGGVPRLNHIHCSRHCGDSFSTAFT